MTPTRMSACFAAAAAAAAAAGCAIHPGTARSTTFEDLRREGGWHLVEAVPFVAQEAEKDCGAACLSMVLRRWGVQVPPKRIEEECAVAGQEGLRAADLRDAAKKRGLSAFLVRGGVEDLRHELERGRPVVVGLIKRYGPLALSHYEVVVGIRPEDGRIAALDPARGLVADSLDAFRSEWEAAKCATLVVFRPMDGAVAGGP